MFSQMRTMLMLPSAELVKWSSIPIGQQESKITWPTQRSATCVRYMNSPLDRSVVICSERSEGYVLTLQRQPQLQTTPPSMKDLWCIFSRVPGVSLCDETFCFMILPRPPSYNANNHGRPPPGSRRYGWMAGPGIPYMANCDNYPQSLMPCPRRPLYYATKTSFSWRHTTLVIRCR